MTPEEYELASQLALEAADLPAEDRGAYLDRHCPHALRDIVEGLVSAHESPENLLTEINDNTESRIGRKLGVYQILREIGRGGMGMVYLGKRTEDYSQLVAIKMLSSTSQPDSLERFLNERQTMARLEHPNIARLLDGGVTDLQEPYLVMEYIEDGKPITDYCEEKRLSVEERLALFAKVCQAVQYAHERKVLHRDVKPSNILVTPDGTPKLVDFGVAKSLDFEAGFGTASSWLRTATGAFIGTLSYASPEQVRGETLSGSSDVYALGLVLYEMLTGAKAFPLENRLYDEAIRIICQEDPEAPSTAARRLREAKREDTEALPEARTLRGDLDAITLKALRKNTQERYISAAALLEDVEHHLRNEPIEARPRSWSSKLARQFRKQRLWYSVAIATCSALAIGLAVSMSQWKEAGLRRNEALSRKLVADAFAIMNSKERDVELAALLSIEALKRFRSPAAMEAVSQICSLIPTFDSSTILPGNGHNPNKDVILLSFSSETARVVATSPESIYIWDLALPRPVRQIDRKDQSWIHSRRLLYGARATDNALDILDLDNGNVLLHRDTGFGRGASIMENPDGSYLAITEADGGGVYKLPTGALQRKIPFPNKKCVGLCMFSVFDSNANRFLFDAGGNVEVSGYEANSKIRPVKGAHTLCQFGQSKDSVFCLGGRAVGVFNTESGTQKVQIPWSGDGSVDQNSNFLALADASLGPRTLKLFDATSGREVSELSFAKAITSLDLSRFGDRLAVATVDEVSVFNLTRLGAERTAALRLPTKASRTNLDPKGELLAIQSGEGKTTALEIWDVAKAKQLYEIPGAIAYSWVDDGRLIVAQKQTGAHQLLGVLKPKAQQRFLGGLNEAPIAASSLRMPVEAEQRLSAILKARDRVVFGECGACSCDGKKCVVLDQSDGLPRGASTETDRRRPGFSVSNGAKNCHWNYDLLPPGTNFQPFGLSADGSTVGILFSGIELDSGAWISKDTLLIASTNDCKEIAKIPISGPLLAVKAGSDFFYVVTLEGSTQARLDVWKRDGSGVQRVWSKPNIGNWTISNSGRRAYLTVNHDAVLFEASSTEAILLGKGCEEGIFSSNETALSYACSGQIEVVRTAKPTERLFSVHKEGLSEILAVSNTGSPLVLRMGDRNVELVGRDGAIKTSQLIAGGSVVGAYIGDGPGGATAYLATSEGGAVQLSQVVTGAEDLLKLGCAGLTRNLSESEWHQFLGNVPYEKTCPLR